MTKMRRRDPGEPFWSAWILRPIVWAVYQFSGEARAIRRYRRQR
jgi:hypothetical protein